MGLQLKFNLILAACFLIGLGLSSYPFYQLSRGGAIDELLSQIDVLNTDGSRITRHAEGPWDLFRLLELARVDPTAQRDRFRVTFNLEGRGGSFELLASSVLNPFGLGALEDFRCPEHL